MYVVTGEKSYLLTDYRPFRKYTPTKFTDSNGRQWWQLAYRWWWWTCYLNRLGYFDNGSTYVRGPMTFDTPEEARRHVEREDEWFSGQA